jgi:glycosyltransferase involved in cell wall biosynthesis
MTTARPLRIAFVVPDFEPLVGGTSRQAGYQARGLQASGHDVVLVTRRRDRALPRREVRDGLPVVRLGPGGWSATSDKLALLRVALYLRRRGRRLDVVQILMQGDLATASLLAGTLDKTWITWAGLGDATELLAEPAGGLRRLQWRVRTPALRRCRHVPLSPPMAAELEAGGLAVAAVIPVPVDRSRFRPPTAEERAASRAAAGVDDGVLAVLYVGHLRRSKAVDRLVEAVGTVAGRRAVRLLLVGSGRGAADDTEAELRAQVARLGLGDVVDFVGTTDDVRRYLWAADVFVLPSEREGLPNTLIEAMACGVPCVAPASAGGDVALADGAGIIPPSNAPDELVTAIDALADDDELRTAVIETATAAVGRFGVDEVVAAYEASFTRR